MKYYCAPETSIVEFICLSYQEWLEENKKNTVTQETEKKQHSGRVFVWGDIAPKQSWQTYTEYMRHVVPPYDYLKDKNNETGSCSYCGGKGCEHCSGNKKCNWPLTKSLIKYGYK